MNYGTSDDVDFVYLGCPHYNIQDLPGRWQVCWTAKKCSTRLMGDDQSAKPIDWQSRQATSK